MRKAKLLLLLLGVSLLIGILAVSLQFNPSHKMINISEKERASILTEDLCVIGDGPSELDLCVIYA